MAEGFDYVEVLPKSSLEKVAEILAGAQAVVSVDTGLSHLTAALDRPNITLYGPTDPGLIGGYGQNQIALTADKTRNIGTISATEVFSALNALNI